MTQSVDERPSPRRRPDGERCLPLLARASLSPTGVPASPIPPTPRHGRRHTRRAVACGALLLALLAQADAAGAIGEAVNGFPNWAERVIHQWMNRARVDPQLEMDACGAPCVERACYAPMPPLSWNEALNRAARFHSDAMVRQGFFAHTSACTLVSTLDSLYPSACNGAASCACVGGSRSCAPTCTGFAQRVQLFGGSPSGEIIATPSNPNTAFYLWLYEPGDTASCQFTAANGHRWLILRASGAVGVGVAGYSTGDFGAGSAPARIPSGAHYPQQASSVAVWANWYDGAAPLSAAVNVAGTCTPMTLQRGTATNGAWSATVGGIGSGCHRYYFSFTDAGGASVTYPSTGSLAIGSGAGCPDWDAARPPACVAGTATPSPTFTPLPSRTSTPSSTRTTTPTASPTAPPTATPSPSVTATLPPSGIDVAGTVRYYASGEGVAGLSVQASAPGFAGASATDVGGHFTLADVATADLVVRPAGGAPVGGAVSALDATWVLQAVASLRSLSAAQQLACDVTGNGTITALDATLLLQRAVGLIEELPVAAACASDWLFLPTAGSGGTPLPPGPGAGDCTPGGLAYPTLPASLAGQDFAALVFGDCTGNWRAAPAALQRETTVARVGRLRRLSGRRLGLPIGVRGTRPLHALEVAIDYDPTVLRPLQARPAGAARNAALAINRRHPGRARLALAGATPIAADGRPIVLVVFAAVDGRRPPAPAVTLRAAER